MSSRTQSIRLFPEDDEILDAWERVLSPMIRPDRSTLIREVLRRTKHCIEAEQAELRARVAPARAKRRQD